MKDVFQKSLFLYTPTSRLRITPNKNVTPGAEQTVGQKGQACFSVETYYSLVEVQHLCRKGIKMVIKAILF